MKKFYFKAGFSYPSNVLTFRQTLDAEKIANAAGFSNLLRARLSQFPPQEGLSDIGSVLKNVDSAEAHQYSLRDGIPVPEFFRAKVFSSPLLYFNLSTINRLRWHFLE